MSCANCDIAEQAASVCEICKKATEYHNQYHLCEAKLSSHKAIIKQDGKTIADLQAENKRLRAWIDKIRPKHRHDHEYFHVNCYLCDIEERDWKEFQQALKDGNG